MSEKNRVVGDDPYADPRSPHEYSEPHDALRHLLRALELYVDNTPVPEAQVPKAPPDIRISTFLERAGRIALSLALFLLLLLSLIQMVSDEVIDLCVSLGFC